MLTDALNDVLLKRFRRTGLTVLLVSVIAAASPPGYCRKVKQTHEVQPGDSVAKIADFYGVSQRDLRELNGLTKGRPLKVGQTLKIPNVLRVAGKQYRVQQGDSLASIGARFNRSPRAIAFANKIAVDAPLPVGRTLVIPDEDASGKTLEVAEDEPQPILFLRVVSGERERLQLYSKTGKLNHKAVQQLSYLARDKRGKQLVKRLHFRLIHMLQQVALEFPGRPIEIISGYRPQSTGNESQHAFGRAMDFRMSGVPLGALFRFCKSLPRSGCGYYPGSGFVHMDAREKRTTWVSHSKKASE
jgi:uncharacterized protein YcbK (DUF882 family)